MLEKFLKKSTWTDIALSLIFILLGAMFIANPELITSMIAVVLGLIFIIIGGLKLIDYFTVDKGNNYLLAIAIVAIIVGIIIMFCASTILSFFRILIAIWILYSGIVNLQTTIVWKDYKSKLWVVSLLLSIALIIASIYILVNTGAVLQTIGIVIVAYGIINIIENVIFIKKVDNFLDSK